MVPLVMTAKKPSPVTARSSDEPVVLSTPSVNCWRMALTTSPEPTALVGSAARLEAITSAISVRLFLKPLVETLARLCEMVDISVWAAWRLLCVVLKDIDCYSVGDRERGSADLANGVVG